MQSGTKGFQSKPPRPHGTWGVECGVCVERCPFDVEVIDKMREAATVFEAAAA